MSKEQAPPPAFSFEITSGPRPEFPVSSTTKGVAFVITGGGLLLDAPLPPAPRPGNRIGSPPAFPAPPPPCDRGAELPVALQASDADAASSKSNDRPVGNGSRVASDPNLAFVRVSEKEDMEETLCRGVVELVELRASSSNQLGYQSVPRRHK